MTLPLGDEIIYIIAQNLDSATTLADNIGVKNGTLMIESKYFSVNVPVRACVAPSDIPSCVKGVIIVDAIEQVREFSNISEDAIKIFLTDSNHHLEKCIENGFELVLNSGEPDDDPREIGIPRLKAALECRAWSNAQPNLCSSTGNPEKMINDFDNLIRRVKWMHEAAKSSSASDTDRREKAAAIASELANLLGVDSDSE